MINNNLQKQKLNLGMKKLYILFIGLMIFAVDMNAQTLEELKAKKAELAAQASAKQAEIDALKGEIGNLKTEIDILSGWMTGFSGNVGFDFNKSKNWVASPNKNATSTSLGVSLAAFANKMTEKTMWRNKGIVTKAWQDVDLTDGGNGTGLFDNGTVDILNLSSLYGYRIHPKFSISALAELSTSVENFLAPGSLDFGVGGTWTPNNNLVVVLHPLNYHIGFSGQDGIESSGALGLKLRADYTNSFHLIGKKLNWSSTLTGFMPYSDTTTTILEDSEVPDGPTYEAGLMEYTWVNSVSFELWKGIGVGVGFGLRNADFESKKTQSYYSLGLSYNL